MSKGLFVSIDFRAGIWMFCLLAFFLLLFTNESNCQKRRQVIFEGYGGFGKYVNCTGALRSIRPGFSYGAKLQLQDELTAKLFLVYGAGIEVINTSFTCLSAIPFVERSANLVFVDFPVGMELQLKEQLFVAVELCPSFILRHRIEFYNAATTNGLSVNDNHKKGFFLPFRMSLRKGLSNRIAGMLTGLLSLSDVKSWQLSLGFSYAVSSGYRPGNGNARQ